VNQKPYCFLYIYATKQYAATVRIGIVVVKPRLHLAEPANVGRPNPHTNTVELQGIIHMRVLVTTIIAEILMGNQVVFGATQQILTGAGNIVTHCFRILLEVRRAFPLWANTLLHT
jgi:hypothetical protein